MHREVGEWVGYVLVRAAVGARAKVIELGSRDWNGTIRHQLADDEVYVGVDAIAGAGVDLVADCSDLRAHFGDASFDVALCLEVLEHSNKKPEIIAEMNRLLRPGGVGILTAGAPGRHEHEGGTDFYGNVDPAWLVTQLRGFAEWAVEVGPNEAGGPDVRAWWRR